MTTNQNDVQNYRTQYPGLAHLIDACPTISLLNSTVNNYISKDVSPDKKQAVKVLGQVSRSILAAK